MFYRNLLSSTLFCLILLSTTYILCQQRNRHTDDRRFEDDRNAIYGSGRCDELQACYPATGNLLIGREEKLKSSSTCGLSKMERYCIVSHLKEKKKCFYCDSRPQNKNNPRLYHGIENIVQRIGRKRKQTWWQAENGHEHVAIEFDLEAEFHFTHLIITFKTFRPSAMLIERSHDFGRSWNVYQYFAYDCGDSFPGIPVGPRQKISDVVCDSHYSGVEPSTEGEVIFRVLPPNIRIDDPYSPEVQNLLKMTNLRINFTHLHNLGDNLLDSRDEIKEKYYYSIYDMVVRGSCSCYGHASRCIADPGQETIPDMVYGRCECTHQTKGLNCEQCDDFYHDVPWKPAIGRQTNACKICNCNSHANRCHFDPAVFEATGKVSGGVCDDCQHNTMGRNCEQCKPYFYRDPGRRIEDPQICQPCDCDPRGSLDDALCDEHQDVLSGLEAGKCHCKRNVEGRRCDRCLPGFWNFAESNPDGCEPCTCNQLGTVGNLGCNVHTGECVCKRNVVGRDCNQCAAEFYGLSSDEEGCKACDCDVGGAYDNSCDITTGQCRCRPHVSGRRCDQPEQGFFAPYLDYITHEAELAKGSADAQITPREPHADRTPTWTGSGFQRVFPGTHLEFDVTDIPDSLEYDMVIRYEPQMPGVWEGVTITIDNPYPYDPRGPCNQSLAGSSQKTIAMPSTDRFVLTNNLCLERGKQYKIDLKFNEYTGNVDRERASILIDSIVFMPQIEDIPFFKGNQLNEYKLQEFDRFRCGSSYYSMGRPTDPPEICRKMLYSVSYYVFDGAYACNCDPTGSVSAVCNNLGGQCTCRPHITGRQCDRCQQGFYGFGPDGCKPCDCHSIGSLDNFCDGPSGQCKCRTGTYGRQCDECQPGYWNYPNCQRCDCSGHADTCDSKTGVCQNCRDFTTGSQCERCERGYYGNPLLLANDVAIPCRPCACPGLAGSGMSHAETCELDNRSQNVLCFCKSGYTGERCDRCDSNYFGDPNVPGGQCQQCQCNNNIDIAQIGNCDGRTGDCLRCLYNTGGPHCETCKPGYWGDATRQQCVECVCNPLGTDSGRGYCDPSTGQCPCLPNVLGKSCDRCAVNHWKIASGQGCDACDCDPQGAYTLKCNEFDGQCHCRPGHGGRRCNECQPNYWGDPRVQCYQCECNPSGSATLQCQRNNGTCVCIGGISGDRCDRCARGFTGNAPHCEACGECFDNWDYTITTLKDNTLRLLDSARRIKQTGTTGAYTNEFTSIENSLNDVELILGGQNITDADIKTIEEMIEQLRKNLTDTQNILNGFDGQMDSVNKRITAANLALSDLRRKSQDLQFQADTLRENATKLQEANVEGAFNITKDAQRRSRASEQRIRETMPTLYESERKRRQTERLLDQVAQRYNGSIDDNEASLNAISQKIGQLENKIPNINEMVCDGRATVTSCDSLCGGAGCGKCGGLSCTNGATTKADNALELATKADSSLKDKEKNARNELNGIVEAKHKSDEALREARAAYDRAIAAKNTSEATTLEVQQLLDAIEAFLGEEASRPSEIRTMAEECLALDISLRPQQIQDLAKQINDTIAGLTDITKILMETAGDLNNANRLKDRADRAKIRADGILGQAEEVQNALKEAADAQRKAEAAIGKANGDINSANGDLVQIESETQSAAANSEKAGSGISDLQKRLDDLKRRFALNEMEMRKADNEANIAAKNAEEAGLAAQELEQRFNKASDKLDEKARASGAVKERAETLRERAKKLAEDVKSRLGILQEMEDSFHENEKRLTDYQQIIDNLNNEMMGHLNHIEMRSREYRTCQA
ncbi:laminin subunit beta-1-like isoform X2 [Oppia nitens]|uniref:laminin subunit beta-1-like isoform X2 n=1 Tax=Oppia nitens TaxID=1686743 RepID=UPI0023D9DBC9|nr:laminin subunit beta-1-like isoform X2 [Oppia nitens]